MLALSMLGCAEEGARPGELGGECRLSLEPCDEGLQCRNLGCFPAEEPAGPALDGRIDLHQGSRIQANGEDSLPVSFHIFERDTETRWAGIYRVWVEPEGAGTIRLNANTPLGEATDDCLHCAGLPVLDGTESDDAGGSLVHSFQVCDAKDFTCPAVAYIRVAPAFDPLEPIAISRALRLVGGGTATQGGPVFDFSEGCGGGGSVYLNGDDQLDLRDTIHPGPGEYTSGAITVERATEDTVELVYAGGEDEPDVEILLGFSSRGLGVALEPGEYEAARRYPHEGESPGLAVFGSERGCDRVTGSFEVFNFELDGRHLNRFTASFIQHCEGAEAALRGCVDYQR